MSGRGRPGHVLQRHSPYRMLSQADKRRAVLRRWRMLELVRCAACDTGLAADDVAAHLRERCPGSRELRDALLVTKGKR